MIYLIICIRLYDLSRRSARKYIAITNVYAKLNRDENEAALLLL